MITRLATKNDTQGILDLQEINLFENLSESEKENGFVTTPFTISQLKELLNERGLFVAESEGKILGYTMAANCPGSGTSLVHQGNIIFLKKVIITKD